MSESQTERPQKLVEHEARVSARKDRLTAELAPQFPEPGPVTLEIGAGHGHWLAAYAAAHPEETCVGIDIISKRVRKGEGKATRGELANLRFFKAEAMEFLECLPEGITLPKSFLLFPDPWPKKRHWKNRLLQAPFLDLLAKRTPKGGALHFRTDHLPYFEWGLDELAAHPDWEIDDEAEWPFEHGSFFQDLMDQWGSVIARRM